VNILNNVRHSASRHYGKRKGECLKAKIIEVVQLLNKLFLLSLNWLKIVSNGRLCY